MYPFDRIHDLLVCLIFSYYFYLIQTQEASAALIRRLQLSAPLHDMQCVDGGALR